MDCQKINNSKVAITLMFFSTAIQAVAGYARDASMSFKLILSLLCWISIFLSIKQIKPVFNKLGNLKAIYIAIAILICMSIFQSLLFGVAYVGNKYLVLFGNMYAALNIVCFFFISSILSISSFKYLRNITVVYTFMSVLLLIYNYSVTIESYFLIFPLTYAMLFIPYVNFNHRIIIIIGMCLSVFAFIGGGRQAVIFWMFNIFAYIACKFLNKRAVFVCSIIAMVLPWILIWYSLHVGASIFEILSDSMTSTNDGLNDDTRTFLYMEVFSDFSSQSLFTILFGKGAIAYYVSDFFRTNERLGVEIPILEWMMQAGILYVVLFSLICLCAISRLYKYGNNKLCKIASVLIASYYFNCFISNLNGCNLSIMAFWFMIYLSNNRDFCGYDDKKWKFLLA